MKLVLPRLRCTFCSTERKVQWFKSPFLLTKATESGFSLQTLGPISFLPSTLLVSCSTRSSKKVICNLHQHVDAVLAFSLHLAAPWLSSTQLFQEITQFLITLSFELTKVVLVSWKFVANLFQIFMIPWNCQSIARVANCTTRNLRTYPPHHPWKHSLHSFAVERIENSVASGLGDIAPPNFTEIDIPSSATKKHQNCQNYHKFSPSISYEIIPSRAQVFAAHSQDQQYLMLIGMLLNTIRNNRHQSCHQKIGIKISPPKALHRKPPTLAHENSYRSRKDVALCARSVHSFTAELH